jgi:elongation of very long chain fatty acids protein 6
MVETVPVPTTLPAYTTLFPFEYKFEPIPAVNWMQNNWHTAFYWIGAYLVLIFGGRMWMRSRERFVLKRPLFIWNLLLATFSIFGAYRMIPEHLYMLRQPDAFHQSVCLPL